MKQIIIVIPVFNETETVTENLRKILTHARSLAGIEASLLVVNDGSTDDTAVQVKELCGSEPDLSLLSFNRNFGKEAAILAGLENAQNADAVIVMDSDLQHPPEMMAEMVRRWQEGAMVVECYKRSRGSESLLQGLFTRGFYLLFDYFTQLSIRDQSDFKLLDRQAVRHYCRLPERGRFFRGLVRWMNYETVQLAFDVPVRNGGRSSWPKIWLFKYAISSIIAFTSLPLQVVTMLGGITFLVSLVIGGIAVFHKLSGGAVDGFTTVILLILFVGSVLMFSLGLIGVYLAGIYNEIKARPVYLVNRDESWLKGVPRGEKG